MFLADFDRFLSKTYVDPSDAIRMVRAWAWFPRKGALLQAAEIEDETQDTLPGNVTVSQDYNGRGYLSQVRRGSTVLEAYQGVDAFGHVTQQTLHDGSMTTSRTVDPDSGRVTAIETEKNAGPPALHATALMTCVAGSGDVGVAGHGAKDERLSGDVDAVNSATPERCDEIARRGSARASVAGSRCRPCRDLGFTMPMAVFHLYRLRDFATLRRWISLKSTGQAHRDPGMIYR